MRSISRVADVIINTVFKLLAETGEACDRFHDETVRNVAASASSAMRRGHSATRRQKNVATAKAAPADAGDVWTWTALDADTKLIVSWQVGGRDAEDA